MKIIYAAVCVAIATASCQQKPATAETIPVLKSDTTFTLEPEIPVRDTATTAQAPVQPQKPRTVVKKTMANPAKAQGASSGSEPVQTDNSTAQTDNGTAKGDNSTAPTAAEEDKMKGWSKTAKGAVIGGVVGAGTGAVVNKKNRAAGAVIGAAIGAGAGAIIGNEMDKKDGRH